MFNEALAISEQLAATRPVYLWHIGLTEPGCDRQAQDALTKRRYRVYRPVMPVTIQNRRGKSIQVSKSLFPGYLFILPRPDGWEQLRESPGIRQPFLMRINDRLATIRDDDPAFRSIEDIEKELWRNPLPVRKFQVGQRVLVTKGPFVDIAGRISALDDDGRNRFLIDALDGKIRIRCSEQHLNPA